MKPQSFVLVLIGSFLGVVAPRAAEAGGKVVVRDRGAGVVNGNPWSRFEFAGTNTAQVTHMFLRDDPARFFKNARTSNVREGKHGLSFDLNPLGKKMGPLGGIAITHGEPQLMSHTVDANGHASAHVRTPLSGYARGELNVYIHERSNGVVEVEERSSIKPDLHAMPGGTMLKLAEKVPVFSIMPKVGNAIMTRVGQEMLGHIHAAVVPGALQGMADRLTELGNKRR
jgi:hypothetical protein